MADASDVTNQLAAVITQALYPSGTGQPSIIGVPIKVYPGWPDPATLDGDLHGLNQATPKPGSMLHVSVYPKNTERNTTAWPLSWWPQTFNAASIEFAIAGNTVTLSGAPSTPQNVALTVGHSNTTQTVTYALQPSDTLTSIATALAAQIQGASSSGAVITVPATTPIQSWVAGGAGTVMQLISRQEREWMVSVWANNWTNRDLLAKPLDVLLKQTPFLLLPDTTSARITYQSSPYNDMRTSVQIYRRDIIVTAAYDTTVTAPASQIVATELDYSAS